MSVPTAITDDIEVSLEASRPRGGQHVDADPGVMIVVHKPTGITIRLPPISRRSQHKRRMAATEAIEWILATVA